MASGRDITAWHEEQSCSITRLTAVDIQCENVFWNVIEGSIPIFAAAQKSGKSQWPSLPSTISHPIMKVKKVWKGEMLD